MGEGRKRRRRPDLRKLMFVLPNLFTVSSIFCGIYSIMLSAGEATGDNFYRAAIAIFFGNFFDAFDGRVARLTKTQSDFGVELDSLADVITFGVAPAILVYKWALYGLGTTGIIISGVYASCGALQRGGVPASDVVGLLPIAVLVLVLAFLMVSTIRYRTFKDAGLNPRTLIAFVVVIAI